MLGGTETIASTLGWILLDLARHPGDQTRVREEIASFRAKIDGTGGLTAADLDAMLFTTAVIKVGDAFSCPDNSVDAPHRSHYD
jgi:cytochrome P450